MWPWLSGVWVEAWLRTYPQRAEELHRQMKAVVAARETGALLSVAEIRDPTSGQNDGAPSQAWSVAECLRAGVMLERALRWKGFSLTGMQDEGMSMNKMMR